METANIQQLKAELSSIIGQRLRFGHRGMNDPNSKREMQAAAAYEHEMTLKLKRANEIQRQIVLQENGISPEEYEHIGNLKITDMESTYHPDDIYTVCYIFGFNQIQAHSEIRQLLRPKGEQGIPREMIYREGVLWLSIAQTFGRFPREIENPIRYLRELSESQSSLDRDTTRIDSAIEQLIYVVENRSVPRALDSMPKAEASELHNTPGTPIPDELIDILDITLEFGKRPKTVDDLRKELERIRTSQEDLDRDIARYNEAIARIEDYSK